jgi:hypothetical protein
MPFGESELAELLDMATLDMPDYGSGSLASPPATGITTLQFVVSDEVAKVWTKAVKESEKRHGKPEATPEASAGIAFGRIIKEWLGG